MQSDLFRPATTPQQQRLDALVVAIGKIATPLLVSIGETQIPSLGTIAPGSIADTARQFEQLMAATVGVTRNMAGALAQHGVKADDWVKWQVAGAAGEYVAAVYRATGRPPEDVPASQFIELLNGSSLLASPTPDQQLDAAGSAYVRLMIFQAFVPVLDAITRFDFNRDLSQFLPEIAQRIQQDTLVLARRLAGDAVEAADFHKFYAGILQATAKLYAYSHYFETDRLINMEAGERERYARDHNNQFPTAPIFEAFAKRLEMVQLLAEQLVLPTQK